MWGGYLSFTGLHGYGFYKRTPIERLLPVELMETDDRVEVPEGFPRILVKDHPILQGIPEIRAYSSVLYANMVKWCAGEI